MIVLKPKDSLIKAAPFKHKVFLAGSIEMGKAEEWQKRVEGFFKNHKDMVLLNPRRDNWDNSIVQSQDDPEFNNQVCWELEGLEKSTKIIMYIDPNSKSRISLLELGLYARSGKIDVICPKGFDRRGNIEVTCTRYNVPLYEDLDLYLNDLKI